MEYRCFFACLLLLNLGGCGEQGNSGVCDFGETQHCACPGGTMGVQDCLEDGQGWNECSCGETDTSTDPDLPDNEVTDALEEHPCTVDADCDDDDICTSDSCDLSSMLCTYESVDRDEDGYVPVSIAGTPCGGNDCDDTRDDVFPEAPVQCDSEDRDCSGAPDNDEDEDGYLSDDICTGSDLDCDDSTAEVNPGIVPSCEERDANCDGTMDCAMAGCTGDCPCTITEVRCDDSADDDCDLDIDCEDDECAEAECCTGTTCAAGLTCCSTGCCNALDDALCCGGCGQPCPEAGDMCCDGTCAECCADGDCDDSDPCTVDTCESGTCSHETRADLSDCGGGYVCCSGACVECCSDGDCDDSNDCTTDACSGGTCANSPVGNGTDCGTGGLCCSGSCFVGDCCTDADCSGCNGTAQACSAITSSASCSTQVGCAWDAGNCTGFDVMCDWLPPDAMCTSCGCYLDSGVSSCMMPMGPPPACAWYSTEMECEVCTCTWDDPGPCEGTHPDCSTYSFAECGSQIGCSWSVCASHTCT